MKFEAMEKQNISETLKSFIREQIQTVSRLEVLLLLHQHRPRAVSAGEVANGLGFDQDSVEAQLAALEAIGLVIHSDSRKTRYKYYPRNASFGALVDHLAMNYATQRVSILSLLMSEHPDRIRLFAEAFRIIRRKD
jgi:DNA-binding IclR family transcriptional regulator